MGYALIPKHKHTFTKADFYKTLKDTEAIVKQQILT